MGMCKIQMPMASNKKGIAKHGKLYAQITCDGVVGEEYDFDATDGDLRLHLICEDEEFENFYIGSVDEALAGIYSKINNLETLLETKLDTTDFENYIIGNSINTGIY